MQKPHMFPYPTCVYAPRRATADRTHVFDFSDRSNIAFLLSLRHLKRVDRLVLNGASPFFDGLTSPTRAAILAEFERAREKEDRDPEAKHIADLQRLMIDEPNLAREELKKDSSHFERAVAVLRDRLQNHPYTFAEHDETVR